MVELPVAGQEIILIAAVLLGAAVGVLGGLLGVGGGFILTPLLNVIFGIPYNVAVGSDLSQMVGMSSSAALRHRGLGNIDLRLGGIMIVSAFLGIECGVRVMEVLKESGTVLVLGREIRTMTLIMSLIYTGLLLAIGSGIFRESLRSLREGGSSEPARSLATAVGRIKIPPMISLPASGVAGVSLWILLLLGYIMGFACGLLGVGGGFIMTPCFIYVLGCPTTVAIGTSLFQIVFLAAFGTFRHSLHGNVDPVLVIGIITGSAVGSQIGATLTARIKGARLRLLLSILLFIAAAFIVTKLAILLTA